MSLFRWTTEKEIHLPEVDAEHRNLYLLSADLKKSLASGAPASEIDAQVRALLAETEDHLRHEENLMLDAHYSMYGWHKGQHDTLRKHSQEYAERIHAGDLKAGKDLIHFMARWLRDHMAVADNMMGAALRNHQRSHAA